MKKHTITEVNPKQSPAYVANGVIGLRVGVNPFVGQTALLAGFTGSHELFGVEAYAPVPAVTYNLTMDGSSLAKNPDGYNMLRQTYDFSTAELSTEFTFTNARGQVLRGESVIYASRSCPTLSIQETTLRVDQPCELQFATHVDPRPLPIKTKLTLEPREDNDGVLWLLSRDESTSAGVATHLQCEGPREFREINYRWGCEQESLFKTYAVDAVPGEDYHFRMMVSYIPSTLHSEPHWQAGRMVKLARWKGFERLRAENRKAWAELWQSRVTLIGASEQWQDVVDASFFYLYTSVHPSSPQSVAPFCLSQRDFYKGHVFWDTESFMFMPPMLTSPAISYAMLEYRYNRLPAARHNAMINGYEGVQYPWQSGATGDEVTRVSAGGAGGAGEQHVNMDVALAFIAHAQVSGDPVFLRERAWPVVKGVCDWIASRVEKTARGYEILFVTGIDEHSDNVNNDSFTNIACKMVLEHGNRIARQLGYPDNALWADIAARMFISVHKDGFIEQFEGCKVRDRMPPELMMAFFPYGYRHGGGVDEKTWRFFLEHDMLYYLSYPMLSGFLGVTPALLGDRALAKQCYERGNLDFFVDPFMMCTESGQSGRHRQRVPDAALTIFLTGRGSLLTGLMMGLTRMDIWQPEFENWFSGPITLPEGWQGVQLGRVMLKGRPARVTAMQGEEKARVEWLD